MLRDLDLYFFLGDAGRSTSLESKRRLSLGIQGKFGRSWRPNRNRAHEPLSTSVRRKGTVSVRTGARVEGYDESAPLSATRGNWKCHSVTLYPYASACLHPGRSFTSSVGPGIPAQRSTCE